MTDRLYVRPCKDSLWQWRLSDGKNWLNEDVNSGDLEALRDALPGSTTPVHLLVPGVDVVQTSVPVEGIDKRHYNKMLPFELEEQILEPVDEIHFAFGEEQNGEVPAVYIRSTVLKRYIDTLTDIGCEVTECIPDFSLLKKADDVVQVVNDIEYVYVCVGVEKSFTVEKQMAKFLFSHLEIDREVIFKLGMAGQDFDLIDEIHDWVPEAWEEDDGLQLIVEETGYWESVDLNQSHGKLNLRRGHFARRLPFARWANIWKIPAIVSSVAFVLSVAVMYGQYVMAKSEGTQIREAVQTVYLDAVPKGRKGDEERRLQGLLKNKGSDKKSQPTNFTLLLSKTAKVIGEMNSVKLTSFRYSGKQKELQANIEVSTFTELNNFKEKLDAVGLIAESPRSTSQGDIYQARLQIKEKK